MGGSVTGGYASLTPGYYHITPYGVSEWIPDGISAVETADSVVSAARVARLYTSPDGVSEWIPDGIG